MFLLNFEQESELLYEAEVPGPPVTLALYENTGGEEGNDVLFGTSDGRVGLVQLGRYNCHL